MHTFFIHTALFRQHPLGIYHARKGWKYCVCRCRKKEKCTAVSFSKDEDLCVLRNCGTSEKKKPKFNWDGYNGYALEGIERVALVCTGIYRSSQAISK